jgi:hypothetical protein
VPILLEAGWAPRPVWAVVEKLVPTGIRSPNRPARSEALYRLSYPGPITAAIIIIIIIIIIAWNGLYIGFVTVSKLGNQRDGTWIPSRNKIFFSSNKRHIDLCI